MPLTPSQLSTVKNLLRDATNEQRHEIAAFMRNVSITHAVAELGPGDKCSISGIRPRYLNGQTCIVKRVKLTRVDVTMEDGTVSNLPAACLTKVG